MVERQKLKNGNDVDNVMNEKKALEQVIKIGPFDTFVEEALSQVFRSCCTVQYHNESMPSSFPSPLKSYEFFWSNGKRHKVTLSDSTFDSSNNNAASTKNMSYHYFADNGDQDSKDTSFLVSMQRVAKITGKYWHDEESTKLCVHRVYGTWTAFRAVVVFEKTISSTPTFDTDNYLHSTYVPQPPAPQLCHCLVSNEEVEKAKAIMENAIKMSCSSGGGYGGQSNKTWSELREFLNGRVMCSRLDWENLPDDVKQWITLRDCFSVGRKDWKYDDAQILYHYTKDPEILRRELLRLKES